MNVDNELMDFDAAGSLAEELPYWGWLDDERSCLTRAGELMSLARISPFVLDGQTPEQLDRVVDRWQRMLSGLDARTRFYFYLLRRPVRLPEVPPNGASKVVTLGQRKRREFLTKRVQDVSAYVAWAYDPGLSTVASERAGPWWMAVAKNWMARRRNAQRSIYLHSSIEAASAAFRQTVDASRALVDDLTPLRLLKAHEASEVLSELTNRPGTPWDGATGSGMNWRLAVSELEAERRNLRLDGEPVVLYSLLSPPGSARSNLLADLYRLDATLTVTLEWRPRGSDSNGAESHVKDASAVGSQGGILSGPSAKDVRSGSIVERWDELLRVAGSLKLGWVTASLLISKLQAGARENVLSRALRDLGRLVKTQFILQWIESEDYRRRIHRQLNKGEALHALRRFLFFAHEGKVQRRQADQQTNQVLCLNLVTNAIVTWSTLYMNAAIEQLRAEGSIGPDVGLGHLSPALYGHINPYGKYRFEIADRPADLRPLRSPENGP